jgi:hypothetical protein
MAPLPHGHAYGDNLFALALLGWPVAVLGGQILAYNVVVLSTFVLSATFAALFGRVLSGSCWAGLVAGLGFAFLPIRFTTMHEVNNLAVMWLPLAAWALVRWLGTGAWRWVFIGVAAALGQFFSSIQLLIHFVFLTAIWLAWLWAASRFAVHRRRVLQVLVAIAVAIGVLAPWARVYARVREFLAPARTTDEMYMYSPPVGQWLSRLWLGDVLVGLFAVAAVLLLSRFLPRARDAIRPPASPHLAPLMVAVAVGFVMAQGPMASWQGDLVPLPFHWMSEVFPLLETVRAPQRAQRVIALFASGAAAMAATWAMTATRRVASRIWIKTPAWIAPVPVFVLAVVVVAQIPAVRPHLRPLSLPGLAAALQALPSDAVVFPVPLTVNWPRRPPLDYLAVQTRARMVGGYGGAIPDLFWQLMRRVGSFPGNKTLEVIRATGATHLLLDQRALAPEQLAGVERLETAAEIDLLFAGSTWQLWHLRTPSGPNWFDPLTAAASTFAVQGPSVVAPGQWVTLALESSLGAVAIDPVVRRRVAVETLNDAGGLAAIQKGHLYSPQVIEPDGFPYQLCFEAPRQPGRYRVRILWPPCPPCRDRSLVWDFQVRAEMPTSRERPVRAYELREVGFRGDAFRRQSLRLDLEIENRDDHVWLARSPIELPSDQGEIALHVGLEGPRPLHRAYLPWQGFHLLPHDLSPGQKVRTCPQINLPPRAGHYRATVHLAPHHVASATALRVELAPVVVR